MWGAASREAESFSKRCSRMGLGAAERRGQRARIMEKCRSICVDPTDTGLGSDAFQAGKDRFLV